MVLVSTHRFDMVERLCSRAIVLSAGRIVARESIPSAVVDTPTDLEAVFMRATDQPDYLPLATRILQVIAA